MTVEPNMPRIWHIFMIAFAIGTAWFGLVSYKLMTSGSDSESTAGLGLSGVFRGFGGMLGLGITAFMALSVLLAELVDWRSDWADGNSARFGAAMSSLWLPFFAVGALIGSIGSLLIAATLVGILAIGLGHRSSTAPPPPRQPFAQIPPPPTAPTDSARGAQG